MAIKIEMLRCFRAVADNGSLADAAQVLGRTPSAVSMMLRQFEDHIGAPLFEAGRKARLTPLGELVRVEATRELRHFDQTIAAIEGLSRAQGGTVRVVATPSVAQVFMPQILLEYAAEHPAVMIDMRDTDSATVQQELSAGRADIGLATLGPMPGFDRHLVFSDRFGVVCPTDHPLARNWDSLGWADLEGQPFIANGLCDQIKDPAFVPVHDSARLNVRNTTSILSLVRAGAGITVLPELAVLPGFTDLTFLPLIDSTAMREVWMLTPPGPSLTPAARALADQIKSTEISVGSGKIHRI